MNLKVLKLSVIAAFLAFASCAFLFSSNKSQAQTNKNTEKRDEMLEKVADYKIWKQVQKPEKKTDLVGVKTDAVPIFDSTAMG